MSSAKRRWLPLVLFFIPLAALHQDWFLWEDRTLVFGFIPSGLLYHGCYSVVAAGFWFMAMRLAWPRTVMDAPGAEADAASAESGDEA